MSQSQSSRNIRCKKKYCAKHTCLHTDHIKLNTNWRSSHNKISELYNTFNSVVCLKNVTFLDCWTIGILLNLKYFNKWWGFWHLIYAWCCIFRSTDQTLNWHSLYFLQVPLNRLNNCIETFFYESKTIEVGPNKRTLVVDLGKYSQLCLMNRSIENLSIRELSDIKNTPSQHEVYDVLGISSLTELIRQS